jgi:hypothetical protein
VHFLLFLQPAIGNVVITIDAQQYLRMRQGHIAMEEINHKQMITTCSFSEYFNQARNCFLGEPLGDLDDDGGATFFTSIFESLLCCA